MDGDNSSPRIQFVHICLWKDIVVVNDFAFWNLFEIIETAYTGSRLTYKNQSYHLKPTLVKPFDFYRRVTKPDSSCTSLLKDWVVLVCGVIKWSQK